MSSRSEVGIFQSVAAVKIILISYTALLAVLTTLTHFAQAIQLTFAWYVRLGLILVAAAIPFIVYLSRRVLQRVTLRDPGTFLLVLALGVLGAVLAVVINTPDMDDFFYVPNAVYYLEHPTQKMGFDIHFVDSGAKLFDSIITNTSLPYEYIQAIVTHMLGTEFLVIYHVVFCAMVGFLIPLVYFYCLSHFQSDPLKNALSVLIMIGIILLLGESHRAIGSLSFARAFQGKMLFLTAGIPLFVAVTYDFFKTPGITSWLVVFATSIAMVGVSATAAVMLPALASVLVMTQFITSADRKRGLKQGFVYLSSLAYLLLYAAAVRSYALQYHGMQSPQNHGWPLTFSGTLALVADPHIPLTACVALSSFVVALLLCQKRAHLAVWTLAALTLYLNPLVSPFIIHHVTSPNIYWRMFFILPFPLTIGVATACGLEYLSRFWSRKIVVAVAATCFAALMIANLNLKISVLRDADVPRYKVPQSELAAAKEIVATAPAGKMLAPLKVAGTVNMLSSRFPQLAYRPEGLKTWFFYRGDIGEAEKRLGASEFLEGKNADMEALKTVVSSKPDLRSMVMGSSTWANPATKVIISQNGFRNHKEISHGLELVWR